MILEKVTQELFNDLIVFAHKYAPFLRTFYLRKALCGKAARYGHEASDTLVVDLDILCKLSCGILLAHSVSPDAEKHGILDAVAKL